MTTDVFVGGSTVSILQSQGGQDINMRKQMTAFPPNFVHSMDASHMHMTTTNLKARGITSFGAVHDSFWAHPADMDVLNEALRESFVELYKPNRLEGLYLDFASTHGKALVRARKSLPEPPLRGDFDINEVMNSPYLFA